LRILETGGAGFIGSYVVDAFIKEGRKVTVVDDLSIGHHDNVNPAADFYLVDITDKDTLQLVFQKYVPKLSATMLRR
jgi:UDP-glucose 4-epimerase